MEKFLDKIYELAIKRDGDFGEAFGILAIAVIVIAVLVFIALGIIFGAGAVILAIAGFIAFIVRCIYDFSVGTQLILKIRTKAFKRYSD